MHNSIQKKTRGNNPASFAFFGDLWNGFGVGDGFSGRFRQPPAVPDDEPCDHYEEECRFALYQAVFTGYRAETPEQAV